MQTQGKNCLWFCKEMTQKSWDKLHFVKRQCWDAFKVYHVPLLLFLLRAHSKWSVDICWGMSWFLMHRIILKGLESSGWFTGKISGYGWESEKLCKWIESDWVKCQHVESLSSCWGMQPGQPSCVPRGRRKASRPQPSVLVAGMASCLELSSNFWSLKVNPVALKAWGGLRRRRIEASNSFQSMFPHSKGQLSAGFWIFFLCLWAVTHGPLETFMPVVEFWSIHTSTHTLFYLIHITTLFSSFYRWWIREVTWLGQGHTARRWHLTLGLLAQARYFCLLPPSSPRLHASSYLFVPCCCFCFCILTSYPPVIKFQVCYF